MLTNKQQSERVDEALDHLLSLAAAADLVLISFGDEYEGRLSSLRDALAAYEAWVHQPNAPTPPPQST